MGPPETVGNTGRVCTGKTPESHRRVRLADIGLIFPTKGRWVLGTVCTVRTLITRLDTIDRLHYECRDEVQDPVLT